ncbi:MAG: alkaline phosphatase [Flavobacteriales bacterium]|nr:alkaline phosphatase [Flavobacteriales bacterium]MCX7650479.1 alkaline phosphatase [Flavobacteriales bacterium]MDW8432533.1 alkaline phosphatase [Flavobacteriales bacterium]
MPSKRIFLVGALWFAITAPILCQKEPAGRRDKTRVQREIPRENRPKNVILMIGDGMGLAQITAGMYANGNQIAFEKFPVVGLVKTASASDLITDSAAGATAYACGQKTYNKAIAVDVNKQPLRTLVEVLEEEGLSTGLVATSSFTDATPACFYAHQPDRRMQEEIANDVLKVRLEVLAGGGRKFFDQRKDGRNLLQDLRTIGYDVHTDWRQALTSRADRLACLASEEGMPRMSEGRGPFLPEFTVKTLEILSRNPRGFFCMIEGSQIDWGGHANDDQYIIQEMLDFNQAIENALNFAQNDKQTLVVVTADHETGGFGLTKGNLKGENIGGQFVTKDHTYCMVPVFAFGPGAEKFSGVMENTEIHRRILALLKP